MFISIINFHDIILTIYYMFIRDAKSLTGEEEDLDYE